MLLKLLKSLLFLHQVEAVVQPDPADVASPVDRDRHAKVVGVAAQVEIKVFRLGGDVLGQAELEAGADRPADCCLAVGNESGRQEKMIGSVIGFDVPDRQPSLPVDQQAVLGISKPRRRREDGIRPAIGAVGEETAVRRDN